MLGRLYTGFITLPWLMRIGLLIVMAGGVLDAIYHSLPLQWAMTVDMYLGHNGWPFHLVALIGMATTLVGIFAGRSVLRENHSRRIKSERSHAIERMQ
jgi:hypothetical protein